MADTTCAPPLAGVKVLDFTRILAGPYCTMLLADLGADVIKIERPGIGDDTRQWGPPFLDDGTAAYYMAVNRNKRSVALDLKDETDRSLALRLALGADVVVENFRAGLIEDLGLGYEDVKEAGLVYCSITAFGPGPKEDEPGYDIAMQALSGHMSVTGTDAGEPAKLGVALLDVMAGLHAAIGIQAALELRRQTGESQRVTVPLYDVGVAALANQASNYLLGGIVPRSMGTAHPNIVPYQAFMAADGYVVIAAGNDRLFARLCDVLGLGHLAGDDRFATNGARVANRSSLVEEIDAAVRTRTVEHWVERFTEARVPISPVRDLEAVFTAPETQAVVETIDDPARGRVRLVRSPIAGLPARPTLPPPQLGEHTDEVRSRLWDD